MNVRWMIYGANGFTGRLLVEKATQNGLQPVLSGRRGQAIVEMARRFGLEARIFGLNDNRNMLSQGLRDIDLVINCAGPFSRTVKPLLEACIKNKVSYFDITGEIDVLEWVFRQKNRIRDAGIHVIPGMGFDVVPTDCLAATLKQHLSDATHLKLAISAHGRVSRGTYRTAAEGLLRGGRERIQGKIKKTSIGSRCELFPFDSDKKNKLAVAIPAGDIATAWQSTRIPNIQTFLAVPPSAIRRLRMLKYIRPFIPRTLLERWLNRQIRKMPPGPSEHARSTSVATIIGEAMNSQGQKLTLRLTCPNGYDLTADAVIAAVKQWSNHELRPGAYTPSQAFGPDFATRLTGTQLQEVQRPNQ